jgi:hypothetical protein
MYISLKWKDFSNEIQVCGVQCVGLLGDVSFKSVFYFVCPSVCLSVAGLFDCLFECLLRDKFRTVQPIWLAFRKHFQQV